MRSIPVPAYTGLNELTSVLKGTYYREIKGEFVGSGIHYFNHGGYMVHHSNCPHPYLALKCTDDGNILVFVRHYHSLKRILGFKDPVKAHELFAKMISNPYYHSDSYYKITVNLLAKKLNLGSTDTVDEIKECYKAIYDIGMKLYKTINKGADDYGCKHRFRQIRHIAIALINPYLINFEGKYYAIKGSERITYDGEWDGKSIECFYKLKAFDFKADTKFNYNQYLDVEDSIRLYLVEGKMLSTLLVPSIGIANQDKDEYFHAMRVINRMAVYRGLLNDKDFELNYVTKLSNLEGDINIVVNTFISTYISLLKHNQVSVDAGYL